MFQVKTLIVDIMGSQFYASHDSRTMDALRTIMLNAIQMNKQAHESSDSQPVSVTNVITFVGQAHRLGPNHECQAESIIDRINQNISNIPVSIAKTLHWHIAFAGARSWVFDHVKAMAADADMVPVECSRTDDFMDCIIKAMTEHGASEEDLNRMKRLAEFVPAAIATYDESKKPYQMF